MNSFREVRDILLVAHSENLINDEELVLLYDLNTSNNIDLPSWSYNEFDLDMMSDDECRSEFRFLKNDIFHLAEILHIYQTKYDATTGSLWMGLKLCVYSLKDSPTHADMQIYYQGLQGPYHSSA